jgi:5'-deoxynucleotidase YfbR-like HD superfamily hydrolase
VRQKLDFIIRGGVVKRFHTMHTLHTQNVAEHSFGVAWLVYLLCDQQPSAGLLIAAMAHDLAEHMTGDIPAPAKRRMQISAQFNTEEDKCMMDAGLAAPMLTAAEQRVLKMADTMDLLLFCTRELALGNSDMHVVYIRGVGYVKELAPFSATEQELLDLIGERYYASSK